MGRRVIFHCDLNCFFASVELLDKPALWEVPVAVCGDPESRHGIILAKNESAKKRGVQTAETVWQAKKKCPVLVLLPPHHDLYKVYSKKVNEIYERFTDLVEPFGIDESWLDVTGSLHLFGGDAKALADRIRETVKEETGLTLSVGVSFNKVFAKLGSDLKKPDATTVIPPEGWQDIVWPLPVGAMLFAGRSTQRTLAQYGIETIGQLAACPETLAEQLLGKMGVQLWQYANGLDKSPVRPRYQHEPVKSVGNGTTFPADLVRWEQIRQGLAPLCDSVATRLRKQGLYAGGVSVTLKSADFKTASRQLRLDERAAAIIPGTPAGERDFDTEFLDYILAVKVVDSVDEAIAHILAHSTGHSECIVTEDPVSAERFVNETDSAAAYVNVSTRFTDGGEFGLGCEMGISTQKLHARGPMGPDELSTYKYIIRGNGQIR